MTNSTRANVNRIDAFKGMDNIHKVDFDKPSVILNLDNRDDGVLYRRPGRVLNQVLVNASSLFPVSNSLCLVAGKGSTTPRALYSYNIITTILTELTNTGIGEHLTYVDVLNKIYISSDSWTGVFDKQTLTLASWGIPVPTSNPVLVLTVGSLPPGKYSVCFTAIDSTGEISGNSLISTIELLNSGGIAIANGAGVLTWCTLANGNIFYLVGSGVSKIESNLETHTPLLTIGTKPASPMHQLAYNAGRIWGIIGKTLVWSEAFSYGRFHNANRVDFPDNLTLIAAVSKGLYVASNKQTWFIQGNDPGTFSLVPSGSGAIEGTLCYASYPKIASYPVPFWWSSQGGVIGSDDGLQYLTRGRLNVGVGTARGASLFSNKGGVPQVLCAMPETDSAGFGDSVTVEVVRKGRVLEARYDNLIDDKIRILDTIT